MVLPCVQDRRTPPGRNWTARSATTSAVARSHRSPTACAALRRARDRHVDPSTPCAPGRLASSRLLRTRRPRCSGRPGSTSAGATMTLLHPSLTSAAAPALTPVELLELVQTIAADPT